MQLINTTTLDVVTLTQFKALFPHVSFPADVSLIDFSAYGYAVVEPVTPEYDASTHRVVQSTPVCNNGVWIQTWTVVELTDHEIAALRPRTLTRVEFLQRLTPAEWFAATSSAVPEVMYFVELVRAAQEINLDDANTQAGLQVAVQAGVLTAERAGVVLG